MIKLTNGYNEQQQHQRLNSARGLVTSPNPLSLSSSTSSISRQNTQVNRTHSELVAGSTYYPAGRNHASASLVPPGIRETKGPVEQQTANSTSTPRRVLLEQQHAHQQLHRQHRNQPRQANPIPAIDDDKIDDKFAGGASSLASLNSNVVVDDQAHTCQTPHTQTINRDYLKHVCRKFRKRVSANVSGTKFEIGK
jgi:hypothetical protein